jgi:hypothetical protein
VENPGERAVTLRIRGEARGMGDGHLVLRVGGTEYWRGELGVKRGRFVTSVLTVDAGARVTWEFVATSPPRSPGMGDVRELSLALYDLVIEPAPPVGGGP